MTSERWERVDQLFHAAAALSVEERSTFLAEACEGEGELRAEVEALLSEQDAVGGFLCTPALHVAARAVAAAGDDVAADVLQAGARLGPYEIEAMTASGGMGEVYKARDTRLDRTVAVKVLPSHLNADPARRARFEREAKAVAALTHPNICTLHDVGEHRRSSSSPPALYLVMEYLVGETLFERLRRGPLPLGQGLAVAADIAAALTFAHRQGIVHRDLKPGNVMLTKTGAKLLDFGLARLTGHGEHPAALTAGVSPGSPPLTAQGVVVGTLHYMAPEQLEGKATDARTDLWALGCIMYEMATGRRPFEGSSSVSVMAAILERDPPSVASFQPLTPPALERLVRRLLSKDPDERPDTAHDVASELRSIAGEGGSSASTRAWRSRRRRFGIAAAAAVSLLAIAAAAGWWVFQGPRVGVTALPLHLDLPLAPAGELSGGAEAFSPTRGGARTAFAWTPDGQAIVFVGLRDTVRQLFLRRLSGDNEAHPIAGTGGAHGVAVSPDGRFVVFWADGVIRKVSLVGGGPPIDLVPGVNRPPWGLAVDEAGGVLFGREGEPISRVTDAGAPPVLVTRLRGGELAHGLPCPLPGRRLLYTVRKRYFSWGDEEIVGEALTTGQREVLVRDGADARFVPPGHLVFLRRGWLFAAAFDPEGLTVSGTPRAVRGGIAQAMFGSSTGDTSGAGQFAISGAGTLAVVSQPEMPWEHNLLVRVDRHGVISPLPAPAATYGVMRRSPDGRRLAVVVGFPNEITVSIYDLARHTLTQRTRGGEAVWPVWSPDSRSIVFSWLKDGRRRLAVVPADSAADPVPLVDGHFYASAFSRDGQRVLAVRGEDGIVSVPWPSGALRSSTDVQSLLETENQEQWPEYSPDKRWMAYGARSTSRQNERNQIYICPADAPRSSSVQVSVAGGTAPAWNPSGREVFFLGPLDRATGKRSMMAVDFEPGTPPRVGTPHKLFDFDPVELEMAGSPLRCYEVGEAGSHFFAVKWPPAPAVAPVTHIELSFNWTEELTNSVKGR